MQVTRVNVPVSTVHNVVTLQEKHSELLGRKQIN